MTHKHLRHARFHEVPVQNIHFLRPGASFAAVVDGGDDAENAANGAARHGGIVVAVHAAVGVVAEQNAEMLYLVVAYGTNLKGIARHLYHVGEGTDPKMTQP